MNQVEYQMWMEMAAEMLKRLTALSQHMEEGNDCRDPRFAIETSEIRALDLLGFKLLGHILPKESIQRLWQLHEHDECTPIQSSIVRLNANRSTFQLVWRLYVVPMASS